MSEERVGLDVARMRAALAAVPPVRQDNAPPRWAWWAQTTDVVALLEEVERLRAVLRDIQNVAEDFLVDAAHARARLDYIGAQARRALGEDG